MVCNNENLAVPTTVIGTATERARTYLRQLKPQAVEVHTTVHSLLQYISAAFMLSHHITYCATTLHTTTTKNEIR